MDIHDRRGLKAKARDVLSAAGRTPERLILVHAGITAAVLLGMALIDFVLETQIGDTGGLGGLGARSVLSTIQALLQNAQLIILPFWNIGYLFAITAVYQGKTVSLSSLLDGFRNFGPVVRFTLLQSLIYVGLAIVCVYPGTLLYMATPMAQPLYQSIMADPEAALANPEIIMSNPEVASSLLYLYLIIFALLLVLMIPVFYRIRMAEFALVRDPRGGAFRAMRKSFAMTRKNCLPLFRLDLSFWWYFLLDMLVVVLSFGDTLLGALGISFPFSSDVAYFLFYILGLVAQTVLYWQAKNYLTLTYCAAYDALDTPAAPPKPVPATQNPPWNY